MTNVPILVVSDTHLGFEDESAERFQHFMTYLVHAVRSQKMIVKTSRGQQDGRAGETLYEELLAARNHPPWRHPRSLGKPG